MMSTELMVSAGSTGRSAQLMAAGVSGRNRRVMQLLRASDRTELFAVESGQGSGVNMTSLKQSVSDSLVFRGVQDLGVMFHRRYITSSSRIFWYFVGTGQKKMLKNGKQVDVCIWNY